MHPSLTIPARATPAHRNRPGVCESWYASAWIHPITQPCGACRCGRLFDRRKTRAPASIFARERASAALVGLAATRRSSVPSVPKRGQSTHAAHRRSHESPHHIHRQRSRPAVQLERPPGAVESVPSRRRPTLQHPTQYLSLLIGVAATSYSRGTCVVYNIGTASIDETSRSGGTSAGT